MSKEKLSFYEKIKLINELHILDEQYRKIQKDLEAYDSTYSISKSYEKNVVKISYIPQNSSYDIINDLMQVLSLYQDRQLIEQQLIEVRKQLQLP